MKNKLMAKAYTSLASFALLIAVFGAIKPMCWLISYEADIPQSLKK